MMNWRDSYNFERAFLNLFDTEQDFIDAMFMQIVMFNYGIFLVRNDLVTA